MGIIQNWRHRVGLFTAAEAIDLYRKMNPVLPTVIEESPSSSGGGYEPLNQSFEAYLASPGLFHNVSACIDAIGNAFAAIPLKLMRDRPSGSDEIETSPLLDILSDPNPEQGDFAFRYGIAQQIGYTGEAIIVTDNENGFDGRPLVPGRDEMWIVRSDRMAPVIDKAAIRSGNAVNPIREWVYTGPTGSRLIFPANRVIQIKRPHPTDPFRGLSPLKQLETILSIEFHALRSTRNYLKNGARPRGLFMSEQRPTKEDVERFKKEMAASYGGSENAGKDMYLWGTGLKYERMGDSMLSDGALDLLKFTKDATLAVFKCPPFVLAMPDGTTWANSREQKQFFYQNSIQPLMDLMLDTMNSSPFVEAFGPGLRLSADYSSVEALQPDRAAQAATDKIYLDTGTRVINEIRAARDFGEPLEWGDTPFKAAPSFDPSMFGLSAEGPSAEYHSAIRHAKAATDAKDRRDLRWKAFVIRTQPIERAWVRAVRPLFTAMKAEVLDTLERIQADTLATLSMSRKSPEDKVPIGWTAEEWFDAQKAEADWTEALDALATSTLRTGAEDVLREVNDLFVPFDTDRVRQFIDTRLATQIRTILQSRAGEVRTIVERAASEGQTIGELEKALRRKFDNESTIWSRRIARTETAGLYNAGAQAGMEDAGIETKEWLSSRDTDVRESHAAVDATRIPLNEDFQLAGGHGPYPGQINAAAENINCLPPCSAVRGSFVAGVRAFYDGRLIELHTTGSRTLSITPNHKVLTAAGFKPAGELVEGDHLLAYRQDVGLFGDVDPDDVPPSIEETFGAILSRGYVRPVATTAQDFDGDAGVMEGQVQVVCLERELGHGIDAEATEAVADLVLKSSNVRPNHGARLGPRPLCGRSVSHSAAPGMSGGQSSDTGLAVQVRPLEALGLAPTADLDTKVLEARQERGSCDAGFVADLLERLPAQVVLDEIVEVRNVSFSGHVYDLQSVTGLMVADNFIVSNCRCTTIPGDI